MLLGKHPCSSAKETQLRLVCAQAAQSDYLQKWLTAKKRVIMLYEEYIHLTPLQRVSHHVDVANQTQGQQNHEKRFSCKTHQQSELLCKVYGFADMG